MLSTPTYHIRKEKISKMLVSPYEVTVIASVEDKDTEPSFQSPPHASAQVSAQVQPDNGTRSSVTSDQLKQISDQWAEQFARFESLLSRGNVFSMPKTAVKPILPHTDISDAPFIAPARLTGPVESLTEVEANKVNLRNQRRSLINPERMRRTKSLNIRDRNLLSHWCLLILPVKKRLLNYQCLLTLPASNKLF